MGVCLATVGMQTHCHIVVTRIVLGLLLKLLSIPGVEPEPFEIGDHIVEASGKLCLLDKLLSFLYAGYVMLG